MFKGIQFSAGSLSDSIQGTNGDIIIEMIRQKNPHWLIFYGKFIGGRWVDYVLALSFSTMMAEYETKCANEEVDSVERFMEILRLNAQYFINKISYTDPD